VAIVTGASQTARLRDAALHTSTSWRRDRRDARDLQASLFQPARDEQERRTLRDPRRYDEMIEYLREAAGFVAAPWCGSTECEARLCLLR
jgi:hypothetical protein